ETPKQTVVTTGRIKDLSMGGCLMSLPLTACTFLYGESRKCQFSIHFPNNEQLDGRGYFRHMAPYSDWTQGLAGFQFVTTTAEFTRLLTYYVHEIDRQRAYENTGDDFTYPPSLLFQTDNTNATVPPKRQRKPDRLTRDLTALGAWLS